MTHKMSTTTGPKIVRVKRVDEVVEVVRDDRGSAVIGQRPLVQISLVGREGSVRESNTPSRDSAVVQR